MKKLRKFQKVCDIIENYDYKAEKLIPILQEIQEEYRYLPEEVMNFVATSLISHQLSIRRSIILLSLYTGTKG